MALLPNLEAGLRVVITSNVEKIDLGQLFLYVPSAMVLVNFLFPQIGFIAVLSCCEITLLG